MIMIPITILRQILLGVLMRNLLVSSISLALVGAGCLVSNQVKASEPLFGYSYGTDTLPAGESEIAVTATHRWDKGIGSYNANDLLFEFEHGVTDRFSWSAYVEAFSLRSTNAFPLDSNGDEVYPQNIDVAKVSAFKGALKYNFLSPYKDGFGLTIVAEVTNRTWYPKVDGARTRQWSFEPKLIVQKNFLDDTLVLNYNLALEFERRIFPDDGNAKENEVAITHSAGISYRFAPNFFAGLEGVRRSDVLNGEYNHYTFLAGPNLHYGSKKWSVTATYLRQIQGSPTYSDAAYPIGVAPQFNDVANSGYHLEEDVKNEFRVKVAYEF